MRKPGVIEIRGVRVTSTVVDKDGQIRIHFQMQNREAVTLIMTGVLRPMAQALVEGVGRLTERGDDSTEDRLPDVLIYG